MLAVMCSTMACTTSLNLRAKNDAEANHKLSPKGLKLKRG